MVEHFITFYDAPNGNPIDHFTQYDTGQSMYAEKWENTREPIFYFHNKNMDLAFSVSGIFTGNYVKVDIPNIMFAEAETMYVRVYQYSDEDSAKTLYTAQIPVLKAKKPDEYAYVENYKEINVIELSNRVADLEKTVNLLTQRITELETRK